MSKDNEASPPQGLPKRGGHLAFEIGILLKGINALFECIAGVALLFIPGSAFTSLVTALTQHELAQDPRDFVATHLLSWAQGFSSSQAQYYAIYLLSHGVIKLAMVAALLRGLLWAYPVSIVVPCQRVVGSNGAMRGYAGGLERKRFLLALEQRAAR